MTADRPLLGIALMLGFCVLAPMGDALGKILGQSVPIGMIVFVRFLAQVVFLGPLVVWTRRSIKLTPRLIRLITIRTVLHIIGIATMFTSLLYLPLADAIAIAFVMPFIMLLLGKFVLGETVGIRRLLACTVGFVGTLLVIQPSFAAVGPPALLPLGVAVVFALFMLVTRQVAKDIDAITLQAISGVIACAMLLPVLFIGAALGLSGVQFASVTGTEVALLFWTGLIGTLAHLFMTWSLRFAPSTTVAPMQYLEIPMATLIGFLVFSDLPNGLTAVGICITIAAGVYIILRERAVQRAAVPA